MSGLRIVSAGFAPTLQDFGRPHVQHLGVPPAGALDPVALRIANALVGNPPDSAAIELRVMGPTLEIAAEATRVALVGTGAPVEIVGDRKVEAPSHQSIRLTRGRRLRIGSLADTGVAYLAVEGGFAIDPVYDSLSTYTRARIGGLDGRALRDGDLLPLRVDEAGERAERRCADRSWAREAGPARVMLGPQDDYFTADSIAAFFDTEYRITREADRMGMRLDGPALTHARGHDIVSDGIATGAIQVPGNGRPIVLLADHQTTGGYPKLGTVISADVPRLGRLRPGDALRFARVEVEEAEAARRALEERIARVVDRFVPAEPWLDEDALYRRNLVSGLAEPD
ncbi:biotin-dependent carboxyltransferase family protein [Thalassobaculum sp.]|uniref:5-oxoprolinase subunit C family protein n=1 Tax=Thalassobaculum sp. TaxID=2022740 RepID=UPI0032EB5BA4